MAEQTRPALTPKQDAFALAYFETANGAEAYRRSYDVGENPRNEWIYVEASQLLDHPGVQARLAELAERAADLSIYTRHKAMEELEEARAAAKSLGQASAMVGATTAKIKLTGLDSPQRLEVTGKDGGPIDVQGSAQVAAIEAMKRKHRDPE